MTLQYSRALIVGAGSGLSASVARCFAREGLAVALAARDTGKLARLCAEIGAKAFACDATQPAEVASLFEDVERGMGAPDVVVYNASNRVRGPFVSLDPKDVEQAIRVSAFGGFLVAIEAARRMIAHGHGRSCSPAPPPASRAMLNRRRSPWASLLCAGSPKALRVNLRPRESMWRISLSTAAFGALLGLFHPTSRTRCSILMRLPKTMSTFSASRGAPGHGRSS